MKLPLSFMLFFLMTSINAYNQSISGNINSSTSVLGYANVDIFKGDKLVASVLTDKFGNFNVKLDTGSYRCEINYAGHEKIVKTIKVKGDEKADFKLKEDAHSVYKAAPPTTRKTEILSGGVPAKFSSSRRSSTTVTSELVVVVMDESVEGVLVSDDIGSRTSSPSYAARQLTAGEINDFSKWSLWTDSSSVVLNQYSKVWNISISQRFTVQVTDQNNLPLANAKLILMNANENPIFSARTDNTGKAELWGSMVPEVFLNGKASILADFKGTQKKIKNAKEFKEGINYISFDVDCQEYQNVEIAFVVDATGSMGDELEYLKEELNDVIFKSKEISNKLNFNFANVFYRDFGDEYITKSQPFTHVLSEAISFISNQSAGGGGDEPEAVEIALDSAINGLQWSDQAITRILFLILDASPRNIPTINSKLLELSKEAAKKGIRIVPIAASGINKSTEYLMRSLALATNGTYTFLTNHSGIGNAHIEPTTDEYKVETMNDVLIRILKSYTYMPNCNQALPELNLNYPDSQVVVTIKPLQTGDSSLTKDSLAGIDSVGTNSFSWKYYPNPTDGIVKIVASKKIEALYLTDLSGKVLQEVKNIEAEYEMDLDLSTYATGIYLIRYPIEDRWISGKIVLQR